LKLNLKTQIEEEKRENKGLIASRNKYHTGEEAHDHHGARNSGHYCSLDCELPSISQSQAKSSNAKW